MSRMTILGPDERTHVMNVPFRSGLTGYEAGGSPQSLPVPAMPMTSHAVPYVPVGTAELPASVGGPVLTGGAPPDPRLMVTREQPAAVVVPEAERLRREYPDLAARLARAGVLDATSPD
jgi:hypothetical protein